MPHSHNALLVKNEKGKLKYLMFSLSFYICSPSAPGISIMQRAHPASPGGRAGRRLWWFRSLNIPGSTSFPDSSVGKKICLQCGRSGFDPWVGKIPWRREWLLIPVFWPGEFHGLCIVHGVPKSRTRLIDFLFHQFQCWLAVGPWLDLTPLGPQSPHHTVEVTACKHP